VQQAEQHQFQMSFFIEPKESSCATQACQRNLAFFPDSFFLNKFSSQVIAERASAPLTARVIVVARQDFALPGMVEVVVKQISYRGGIEVYDFVCFLCKEFVSFKG
jgi:hypothetical protein